MALAALAWGLGPRMPDSHEPFLASISAILTMQITVSDSVATATQRILGVIVGASTAPLISVALGVSGRSTAGAGGSVRWRPGRRSTAPVAVGSRLKRAAGSRVAARRGADADRAPARPGGAPP
ncbi:MAG: hypothetical protein IT337_06935, partial [Thermomicrobiales bacterium]|nr:hypothetical protein [Thermomicrobiales bacterium]